MDKKIFALLLLAISIVSVSCLYAAETTTHDFEFFNMTVPADEQFTMNETGQDGFVVFAYDYKDGDPIGDNILVFYYNQTVLGNENSTNFTDAIIKNLDENTTFKHPAVEDGFTILHNQMIQHDGGYMVVAPNDNNTEVVCVVGNNLDALKTYAKSIEF